MFGGFGVVIGVLASGVGHDLRSPRFLGEVVARRAMMRINVRSVLLAVLPTLRPYIEANLILTVEDDPLGHKLLVHTVKRLLDVVVPFVAPAVVLVLGVPLSANSLPTPSRVRCVLSRLPAIIQSPDDKAKNLQLLG